jgi:hypothetical protein
VSTIIQRTNPDRKMTAGGERWACAACGRTHDEKADAITCAENDHALGHHRYREPIVTPDEPFDLVCPPCDLDAGGTS